MAHNEGHCSATSMSRWAGMSPELSPQEIRGKKVQFVTAMRPSMIHVFSDGGQRARATDLSSMLEEERMTRLCDTGRGRAFGLGFKDRCEESGFNWVLLFRQLSGLLYVLEEQRAISKLKSSLSSPRNIGRLDSCSHSSRGDALALMSFPR